MSYLFRSVVSASFLLASAISIHAADSDLSFKGAGTQSDPWQIATKADVLELARACNGDGTLSGTNCSHYAGKYFILTADIDMTGVADFYGIATAPKGQSSAVTYKFQGNMDGQGHTIRNMTIRAVEFDDAGKALSYSKTGSRKYCGFFGTIEGGTIKNISIDASCTIEGWGSVGSIAGQANAGARIENCSSAATLIAYDSDCGGIVGYANGSKAATSVYVTDCLFTGNIRMNYRYGGGIAGETNYAYISRCTSMGSVELSGFNPYKPAGQQQYGGGIAGSVKNGGIADCFSATTVVSEGKYTGGITGILGTTSSLSSASLGRCVSIGSIISSDTETTGGLAGFAKLTDTTPTPLANCYFDTDLWGDTAIGRTSVTAGQPTRTLTDGTALPGLSTDNWIFEKGFYPRAKAFDSDATRRAAATYVVFAQGENAGDFSTQATVSSAMSGITASMAVGKEITVIGNRIIVGESPSIAYDTIQLTNGSYHMILPVIKPPRAFSGAGTEAEPYLISSKEDLLNLAALTNASKPQHFENTWFRLTTDLDMTGTTGFQGIASKNTGGFISPSSIPPHYFAGHFDGQGHTIRNLHIAGIVLSSEGEVIHYGTVGGSAMNVGFFGILYNGGSVENLIIDSSCSVDGYMNVGGIAGFIGAGCSVKNCVNGASVDCFDDRAGGIVGYAYSSKIRDNITISECVNYGNVRANDDSAGGIAGDSRGVISDCVNAGDVTVEYFNSCVNPVTRLVRRAGGIVGGNTGDVKECVNFGTVYADSIVAGGIAGYNSNGMSDSNKERGGRIERCLNAGPVGARDLKLTGAIAGEDYHVTGTEFSTLFSNCLYDSQYSAVLGAQGVDATGITSLPTDSLISGKEISEFTGFSFTEGYYPVPAKMATAEIVRRIASTFIRMPGKETLGNFTAPAYINTTMPLTASLSSTDAFFIEEGMVKTRPVTKVTQSILSLTNGAFTRRLTLTTLPSIFTGEGTKDSPYVISTTDDFNKIGSFMAESGFDFEDRWFQLTSDLDFEGKQCIPAGSTNIFFNGTFDGNKKTIRNFRLPEADETTDLSDAGLFGGIGSKGTVFALNASAVQISANLNAGIIAGRLLGSITGCTVDSLCKIRVTPGKGNGLRPGKKGEYAGGITGYMTPTAYIADCVSGATVIANKRAGGIVGGTGTDDGALIERCHNYGTIGAVAPPETIVVNNQPQPSYVEVMAGGIAGHLTGSVRSSSNSGHILATQCTAAGGIVGSAIIIAKIDSCRNEGLIEANWEYAGGIVGATSSSSMEKNGTFITACENLGTVKTLSGAGGMVGMAKNGCRISFSTNFGIITATGRAGGIAGRSEGAVSIADSYNTGAITARGRGAGGLVGEVTIGGLSAMRCFNVGRVVAETVNGLAGGILNVTSGPVSVSDCYNAGDITAPKTVGGLAGDATESTFTRCYNAGTVTCTSQTNAEKYAGNIFGRDNGKTINCYFPEWLPGFALDASYGEKLTNNELFESRYQLGDQFEYSPLTLPRIKTSASSDAAKAFSALWLLAAENTMDQVSEPIHLSSLPGVVWTTSGNLSQDGDTAIPTGNGEGLLTASCGTFSRTFRFNCTDGSGVENISIEDLSDIRWFNLAGVEISFPRKGEIVIMTAFDRNGNPVTRKIRF